MRLPMPTAALRRRQPAASGFGYEGLRPQQVPSHPKKGHGACDRETQITCGNGCCDAEKQYCVGFGAQVECRDLPVDVEYCHAAKNGNQFCVKPPAKEVPSEARRGRGREHSS